MRLIQIEKSGVRRVALVEEPHLRLLDGCGSIYELAGRAVEAGAKLSDVVHQTATGELLDYDPIYLGESPGESGWRILPPIDHPEEPSRCIVSGTGLTHLGSARNRNAMHAAAAAELTD